jgi:mannosyltransferase
MIKIKQIGYRHLLVFSILLGTFLRFHQIGAQPLWLDEAFSHWFSSRTMLELWTIVPKFEANPPLYYTLLKLWRSLFGSSEACLRSLSAVMSIGCIPLVFMLGRLMGKSIEGNWLGAMGALMFSLSPLHIQYAQEARPYAMLTFGATLVLCASLWIVRHPTEACEPIISKLLLPKHYAGNSAGWSKSLAWMITVVAIAFTLWLHNTSILYILTISLIILAWFSLELRFNRIFLVNLMVVAFIVFLLWAPYLIFLIPQAISASLPIPKPTFLSALDTVVWLLYGNAIPWATSTSAILKIVAFVFIIAFAAVGLLNIRRRGGQYVSILILGSIFGPILLELLFSATVRPIFLARTIIYVSVPFYIAVAAGILMLRDSRKRIIVMMMISLIFSKWTFNYYREYQKEPWDKIANIVASQAKDDVVLLVPNNLELPFSYYMEKTNNSIVQIIPLPFPISFFLHPAPNLERLSSDSFKAIQIRPSDVSAIDNVVSRKSPIWLVTRAEYLFDPDRIVYNALIQKRKLITQWRVADIRVFKFN